MNGSFVDFVNSLGARYNGHFFTSLKKTIGVYENIDCVF